MEVLWDPPYILVSGIMQVVLWKRACRLSKYVVLTMAHVGPPWPQALRTWRDATGSQGVETGMTEEPLLAGTAAEKGSKFFF